MDMLDTFTNIREYLRRYYVRAVEKAPLFRDGTAKATWLDQIICYEFEHNYNWLLLYWHLANVNKATITEADFPVGTAELEDFNILPPNGQSFVDWIAGMTDRDRPNMIEFFQTHKKDPTLAVQSLLADLRTLLDEAAVIADGLISHTGDPETIKYTDVGSIKVAEGKTVAEMGLVCGPLADKLDAIAAKTAQIIVV